MIGVLMIYFLPCSSSILRFFCLSLHAPPMLSLRFSGKDSIGTTDRLPQANLQADEDDNFLDSIFWESRC